MRMLREPLSVDTTRGAQESATAAMLLIKHLGTLLINTGVVTSTEVARLVRAAGTDAASLGATSGPAVAEIIRAIGVDWKKAE